MGTLWGTDAGFRTMRVREVVEDVSIEDGDCPFAGVRPKAGSGGNIEVFSVRGERCPANNPNDGFHLQRRHR